MAQAAISYGTTVWLAELARNGWNLTVTQELRPAHSLSLCDDEFEPLMFIAPSFQAGVLASRLEDGCEGAGIFVPCASADEALRLLERVEAEVGGMA